MDHQEVIPAAKSLAHQIYEDADMRAAEDRYRAFCSMMEAEGTLDNSTNAVFLASLCRRFIDYSATDEVPAAVISIALRIIIQNTELKFASVN